MLQFCCHTCQNTFTSSQALCPACNSDLVELQPFPTTIPSPQTATEPSNLNKATDLFGLEYDIVSRLLVNKEIKPAKYAFISSLEIKESDVECAICMKNEKQKVITFECGHMFHASCAIKWLKLQNTCPICRIKLD